MIRLPVTELVDELAKNSEHENVEAFEQQSFADKVLRIPGVDRLRRRHGGRR